MKCVIGRRFSSETTGPGHSRKRNRPFSNPPTLAQSIPRTSSQHGQTTALVILCRSLCIWHLGLFARARWPHSCLFPSRRSRQRCVQFVYCNQSFAPALDETVGDISSVRARRPQWHSTALWFVWERTVFALTACTLNCNCACATHAPVLVGGLELCFALLCRYTIARLA